MDDLGLSPVQQLELHELTEQAMASMRVDPFGEAPTAEVSSPWTPVATVSIAEEDLNEEIERFEAEYNSGNDGDELEPEEEGFNDLDVAFAESLTETSESTPPQEEAIEAEGTQAIARLQASVAQSEPEPEAETTATSTIDDGMLRPNVATTDDGTARFSSAVWYQYIQNMVITLAGVGGIGSWIALLLGKMQPKAIFLFDNDDVETVNMAGQLYSVEDVGKQKVDALANTIKNYANYGSAFAIPSYYTAESEPSDIMICGFDNMAARKLFFEKWKNHVLNKPEEERANCLYLDGRLAAEELQVFCITGDNSYAMNKYEAEYLFTDEEAEATICSYKQTAYVANLIAGIIVNNLVNFAANRSGAPMPRPVPFRVSYDAETMFFTQED